MCASFIGSLINDECVIYKCYIYWHLHLDSWCFVKTCLISSILFSKLILHLVPLKNACPLCNIQRATKIISLIIFYLTICVKFTSIWECIQFAGKLSILLTYKFQILLSSFLLIIYVNYFHELYSIYSILVNFKTWRSYKFKFLFILFAQCLVCIIYQNEMAGEWLVIF